MYCHIRYSPSTTQSRAIHNIIQKCSCFLSVICCIKRVTQLKSWIKHHLGEKKSLHLNTFSQYQIRLKTHFTTKKHNAEMSCHMFSHRRHSPGPEHFIHHTMNDVFLWYWVDCLSLNTNNCSFWKLNNRFWRCNKCFFI